MSANHDDSPFASSFHPSYPQPNLHSFPLVDHFPLAIASLAPIQGSYPLELGDKLHLPLPIHHPPLLLLLRLVRIWKGRAAVASTSTQSLCAWHANPQPSPSLHLH